MKSVADAQVDELFDLQKETVKEVAALQVSSKEWRERADWLGIEIDQERKASADLTKGQAEELEALKKHMRKSFRKILGKL